MVELEAALEALHRQAKAVLRLARECNTDTSIYAKVLSLIELLCRNPFNGGEIIQCPKCKYSWAIETRKVEELTNERSNS